MGSYRVMWLDFSFKGDSGMNKEVRLERVSGHEVYQEAGAVGQ